MYEKQKRTAQKFMKKWVYWLGLDPWKITASYYDGSLPNASSDSVAATCDCDYRYMEANIKFNLHALRLLEDDEIEKVVVHELAHVLINEMRSSGMEHEERTATILQKAFIWVRSGTRRGKL